MRQQQVIALELVPRTRPGQLLGMPGLAHIVQRGTQLERLPVKGDGRVPLGNPVRQLGRHVVHRPQMRHQPGCRPGGPEHRHRGGRQRAQRTRRIVVVQRRLDKVDIHGDKSTGRCTSIVDRQRRWFWARWARSAARMDWASPIACTGESTGRRSSTA